MAAKFDAFVLWFTTHRTVLGSGVLGTATLLIGAGQIYGLTWATSTGGFLTLVGTTLVGAGAVKSDQFYRERQEVLETKVDRRAPALPIPTPDLKALQAKVEDKPAPPAPPYREVPPSSGD